MSTRLTRRVIPKTAAYTIVSVNDAPGTIFTNRGAVGSVTITLPAPNTATKGHWYEFRVFANQSFIVAGLAASDLVAPGDVAADNVGFQIGSKKIGRGLMVESDGTSWFAYPIGTFDGFCVDGTEAAPSLASGTTLTTPTVLVTTTGVTGTGATGGAGAVLPTVTPAFVYATGASGSGVDLPTGPAGAAYFIANLTTGALNVYCVGGTINGTTGTTAFPITATGNRSAWAVNTSATGAWQVRGNT